MVFEWTPRPRWDAVEATRLISSQWQHAREGTERIYALGLRRRMETPMLRLELKPGDLVVLTETDRISVPQLQRGQSVEFDVFNGDTATHVRMLALRPNRILVFKHSLDRAPAQHQSIDIVA